MQNVRFIGFENVTRDGIVFGSLQEMISAAASMMVADGKVYTSVRTPNSSIGGKFARKAARKAAKRAENASDALLIAAANELGIDLSGVGH